MKTLEELKLNPPKNKVMLSKIEKTEEEELEIEEEQRVLRLQKAITEDRTESNREEPNKWWESPQDTIFLTQNQIG